ncbi:hypothetical protein NCLIV_055730 [Neospora caninum Liverpool]|uniref:Apicoplast-associated thioredoxin family protein Atrx1 n=1 Tax=Neospora caninum (strain Liverpool) TaxID=572307 RepID=F0VN52_NEOCL|nr:hypothetical protein NCLIV_055730 [Neospora caninum Liverpool]CBZ55148.1 hypothetical protein NCLIV_055730 [Neospora caninum Liverpool]CEL69874.1 TPA: apicoplast-associated thioredoxin family protein Atrx1 [Neospora caninum Liverpool]|eukprot:XP_003885176.1 hypothetical protein NCLIV_055730 [Neospora caninum Liverpool]
MEPCVPAPARPGHLWASKRRVALTPGSSPFSQNPRPSSLSLFALLSVFSLFSLVALPPRPNSPSLHPASAISLEPSPESTAGDLPSAASSLFTEKEAPRRGRSDASKLDQQERHLARDAAGQLLPVSASSLFADEQREDENREAMHVGGASDVSSRIGRSEREQTPFFASVSQQPSASPTHVLSPTTSSSLTVTQSGRARKQEGNTCTRNSGMCREQDQRSERSIQRHRHDSASQRDGMAFASFGSSKNSFASAYSPFDEEEDGALSNLGRQMKAAVTCPAAKILLGLSGVVALGTLGIKYTRSVLRRRRRERLERPPTPFTDLLGHVLLKREAPADGAPSTVLEEATGDVLGKAGSVTALYFSGRGVEEMLQARGYQPFTPRLQAIVDGCRQRGQELNVVYLSADADSREAEKHFSEMTWYALPFDDAAGQSRIHQLYRKFRVSTLPHVVLLDQDGKVINPHAYASMIVRPGDFPWRKKSPMELLGDDFLDGEGTKLGKETLSNKVVGIYFSASWCPPCQAFTPKLVETVKGLKEQGKDVEIVFVSNDRDEKAFEEYFKRMDGFLAVPYADTTRRAMLQEALSVRSLPTLVWLSKEGEVLTKRGVPSVLEDPDGERFPWQDKDINDVSETVEGIADEPALILFMEQMDEGAKEEQEKALEDAMRVLRSQKNDGGVPPLPRLFTAKKLSPRSIALRRICRQEPAPGTGKETKGPTLTIVDLIDQSYYTYPQDDSGKILTADEIVAFVKKFRNEELERNSLAVPE